MIHHRQYFFFILIAAVLLVFSGCAARQSYIRHDAERIQKQGRESLLRTQVEEKINVVVIDPGHGGKAMGAVGPTGLKEKNATLGIAKKLKRLLEQDGYMVFLTRRADYDVSLSKRRDIARDYKADLFISIHCDANKKRAAHGSAVYILSKKGVQAIKDRALTRGDYLIPDTQYERKKDRYLHKTIVDLKLDGSSRESRIFADLAVSSLTEELGTKNLGVKRAAFAVLKNVDIPSCLVEVAFITNWWEEKLLKQNTVRQRVAKALAKAVHRYFEEE